MRRRSILAVRVVPQLAALLALSGIAEAAVEVAPHRAVYTLSLKKADAASGIAGADGKLEFIWADACELWTVEQRYALRLTYSDGGQDSDSDVAISFVTSEAKDGRHYRYFVRKDRGAEDDEEFRGDARLDNKGSGEAHFTKPQDTVVKLPTGTVFPSRHTIDVLTAAMAGETFLSRLVFDGGAVEASQLVTAAIGAPHPANADETNPLLRGRWWTTRLAFFTPSDNETKPDYELGMDLQENGVARAMTLDYGSFVVRATLDSLEKLPKPRC